MDCRGVALILSNEHPQTISVAMSRLEPELAGEIIKFMPQELQVDVLTRMARVEQVPVEIIDEIDALLGSLLKR